MEEKRTDIIENEEELCTECTETMEWNPVATVVFGLALGLGIYLTKKGVDLVRDVRRGKFKKTVDETYSEEDVDVVDSE